MVLFAFSSWRAAVHGSDRWTHRWQKRPVGEGSRAELCGCCKHLRTHILNVQAVGRHHRANDWLSQRLLQSHRVLAVGIHAGPSFRALHLRSNEDRSRGYAEGAGRSFKSGETVESAVDPLICRVSLIASTRIVSFLNSMTLMQHGSCASFQ